MRSKSIEIKQGRNNHNQNEVQEKVSRALYARVSTREQLEGFGIDAQLTKMREYLHLFEYDETNSIITTYLDEGISAKNMNRPRLKDLIEDIIAGKVKEVIIYKLDRLARSVQDVYYLLDLMIKHECNLIAVMDNMDIHSANGRMLVGMLAVIAQWERETISERTIDGMEEMCKEGLFPYGHTPFGYTKKDRKLEINKTESEAFVYIVKCACDGMNIGDIETNLYREYGIKKRGDRIKEMVNRDLYCGHLYFRGKLYDNIVPALVTKDELLLARKTFKTRASIIGNNKYHFRNKIRTVEGDICSCRVTKKKTKNIYYYVHGEKRINQDLIANEIVVRLIQNVNWKSADYRKDKIARKINKTYARIDRVYEEYCNEVINTKVYGYTISKLQKEVDELLTLHKLQEMEEKFSIEDWYNMNDNEKYAFVDQYISYIVVDLDLKLVVKVVYR